MDYVDPDGQVPDGMVTNAELLQLAHYRIQENVDMNKPSLEDESGYTLLHYAVTNAKLNLVQLLIEHGADVNLKNSRYLGPLDYAFFSRTKDTYDVYKLLLEKGADCKAADDSGITPLHRALRSQPLKTIKLLVDHGADMTALHLNGMTSLHQVSQNSHVDVVQFVLDHGFDIDCMSEDGVTPLHHAAANGSPEASEFFLRRGAMVNTKSLNGKTPLIYAVQRDHFNEMERFVTGRVNPQSKIVELLLECGANLSDEKGGKSILEIATGEQCSVLTRNYLVRHVAKMQYLKLDIREKDRQTIEKEDCYKFFYRQCLQELEKLKETKIYNNVAISTILMGSSKVISGLARNKELVQALEEVNYDNEFPIYFSWLRKRFYAEVRRQEFRKFVAISFNDIFRLNDPLHAVTQKILSYLKNDDLIRFICPRIIKIQVSKTISYR